MKSSYLYERLEKLVMGVPQTEFLVYELTAGNKRLIAGFLDWREAEEYCKWRYAKQPS